MPRRRPSPLQYAHNGEVRIAYMSRGEGPPVVMVHGYMARRQIWALQAAGLARSRRLVMLDRRGSGDSDRPDLDYEIDHQLGDLEAVLASEGLDEFDLVGHSMGGFIAVAYAARNPGRVRRLALLAAAPYRIERSDFGVGVFITEDGTPPRWTPDVVEVALERLIPEPDGAWLRMEMGRTLPEYDDPEQASLTFSAFEGVDLRPELHHIDVPTLVLHGTADHVVPLDVGVKLAAAIDGARFEPLDGLGHMLMITGAREINRLLDDFLTR